MMLTLWVEWKEIVGEEGGKSNQVRGCFGSNAAADSAGATEPKGTNLLSPWTFFTLDRYCSTLLILFDLLIQYSYDAPFRVHT